MSTPDTCPEQGPWSQGASGYEAAGGLLRRRAGDHVAFRVCRLRTAVRTRTGVFIFDQLPAIGAEHVNPTDRFAHVEMLAVSRVNRMGCCLHLSGLQNRSM